ncbi:tetratricopeptide repeat-containing diguanylate cyclase [Armatimonas rosea]|uniref:Diguanylate cyclase (GGDEF)-like protein n=1 Tax=Armatimonas rosea TaxID=685828 RepID=A0A7W9SSE7_ARMRO|nr:tetratricopeptide repeat-containing diguanylate cyclase [Armatimonas rosea]MBB6051383.1 diguanylate cyclase (GGDEF)-like protein [Armatimonas rosea]
MSQTNEALDQLLAEATQWERRSLTQAQVLAQEALRRCQEEDYASGCVYAQRLLAGIALQEGRMDEAAQRLEEGLALARPLGDPAPISACLYTRGWLLYSQGALWEAIASYSEAATLRAGPGLETPRANTFNAMGIVYRELGDYDQSLACYSQARALFRQVKDVFGEGTTLNNLGLLEADWKSYTNALRYYHETLECALACGDLMLQTSAYYNIALAHILLDEPWHSVPFARHARRTARVLGNPSWRINARLLDGMVYCALRRFPRAERSLLWALQETRTLPDNQLELRVLNELGNLYLRWQRPHEARGHLERCLELAGAMQANLQLVTCHEYLVETMELLQDFERALYHHKEFHRMERQRFDSVTEKQRLMLRMSLDIERREREAARQRERNRELEELTRRDSMTGLYNHRAFQEFLRESLAREKPLALLFLDVDHFKDYNDTFGHPAGDEVLQRLARVLCESLHEGDIAARYGGEEFAVILTGASAKRAHACAAQLGQRIRETPFPHRRVTLSVGVALATKGITPDRLIAAADTALYQAKNAGRDRWARAA